MHLQRHVIITPSPWFTLGFSLGVTHSVVFVGLDNHKMRGIYQCSITQGISLPSKSSVLLLFIPPSSQTLETTNLVYLFTVSIVLPFPECHVVEVIQYIVFSDWFLSLSMMISRSIMLLQMALFHSFL